MYTRHNKKWSVNELLALQREYELLDWSIDQIALKHQRTPNAIMHKLDYEGLADYNVLYSNYYDLNQHIPLSSDSNVVLEINECLVDTNESDSETDLDEDISYDNLREYVRFLESQLGLNKKNPKTQENNRAPESNRGPKGKYVEEYPGYNRKAFR